MSKPQKEKTQRTSFVGRVDRELKRLEGTDPAVAAVVVMGSAPATIDRMVKSVAPEVDAFLFLDTRSKPDATARSASDAAMAVGRRATFRSFEWCNDFSAARNAALKEAAAMWPRAWLLIVDTDEWMTFPAKPDAEVVGKPSGILERAVRMAKAEQDAFLVRHARGGYTQPRLVRASAVTAGTAFFGGRTHEAMTYSFGTATVLEGVRFHDEPKSRDAALMKFERDLVILKEEVAREPLVQRHRYYLAQTYDSLSRIVTSEAERRIYRTNARINYRRAAKMDGWAEEGAWAAYQAALLAPDRVSAIAYAMVGLRRFPIAELAWLIGYESYYLGEFAPALSWAQMAIALGHTNEATRERRGFREPEMLFHKPIDLAAFAADKLGKTELAQRYRAGAEEARARWAKETGQ
jgi:hypothetical protein